MKTIAPLVLIAAALMTLSGCAYLTEPPNSENGRLVTPIIDSPKRIIVNQPLVYGNQQAVLTKGIGLPVGVYLLEAEDNQYWYFRSAKPLEYRTYQKHKVTEDAYKPGGVYLSKTGFGHSEPVVAGAYLAALDPSRKMLIWPLGQDFLKGKGSRWTADY